MNRFPKVAIGVACAAVVVGLVALAAPAVSPFLPAPTPSKTPVGNVLPATGSPTQTAPPPAPTEALAAAPALPAPAYASCDTFAGFVPVESTDAPSVNGLEPTLLVDSGPALGAAGDATVNDHGQPVAYTAAEGDTFRGISERFCIGTDAQYLEMINSIRRQSSYSYGGVQRATVYPGDVINLSPWTVASVGSESGQVYSFTPPFALPAQS